MSTTQRIIWTALPQGFGGGTLRVGVFVSPRLRATDPQPQLSQFPDFVDWPAKVSGITWEVVLNGTPLPAVVTSPPPSSARWAQLFRPTAPVDSHALDRIQSSAIHSYPAGKLHDYFDGLYRKLAVEHGAEHPPLEDLLSTASIGLLNDVALRQVPQRSGPGPLEAPIATALENDLAASAALDLVNSNATLPPPGSGDTDWAMYLVQHKRFFRREAPPEPPPAVDPPRLDFHRAVSALGDHPALLRLLGLVVELECPVPLFFPPNGIVSVRPTWTPMSGATDVLPQTRYDAEFLPGSLPGADVVSGVYLLDDPAKHVAFAMDVDGAAFQVREFATAIARAHATSNATGTTDSPARYALPSIRSEGISVARTGQARRMVRTLGDGVGFDSLAEANPPGVPVFSSDDVTRGYRIDVQDSASGRWFPLCRRTGSYTFDPAGSADVEGVPPGDEGAVSLALAGDPNGSPNDLYMGETFLRWEGWSLVAPRSGKAVNSDPTGPVIDSNPDTAGPDFPLEAKYTAAPGSLPRLRYGRSYRLRARAVDLSGRSLDFDENAPVAGATAEVFYGRLDPILAPTLYMRLPRTEGDGVERMVIRSNYDVPDGAVSDTQRHVAPPVTGQLTVEQHGRIDTAPGPPDKSLYTMLATRDFAQIPGGTTTEEDYDLPHFDTDEIDIPYLADVATYGATFQGLPGDPTGLLAFPFTAPPDAWPDVRAFRLRMVAGPTGTPPAQDISGRELTVTVPKGETVTVRYGCNVEPVFLEHFQVWRWILEDVPPGPQQDQLADLILQGRHWMVTPWRELILVHAVRQPLRPPKVLSLAGPKTAEGETGVPLDGALDCDRKSTARLELHASWDEYVDVGKNPGPTQAVATPVILNLGLPAANETTPDTIEIGSGSLFPDTRHHFGDTKHRVVDYETVATTRFAEYFMQRATVTLTAKTWTQVDPDGIVAGQETVTDPTEQTAYLAGTDYEVDGALGRIRRITGTSIKNNSQVLVKYVIPPITRTSNELSAPEDKWTLNILSSARPAQPDVRYVIPTFAWERSTTAVPGRTHARLGRGLRVWLGRGWWSSGEGELLGVVCWPDQGFPPNESQIPYVTMWGRDPAAKTADFPAPPFPYDFPLAVATDLGLSLRELGSAPAGVAGHEVVWDQSRRLWYCDIEFAAGTVPSYWPFVRLSLARYQPDSIPGLGLELSPVVLAEFAQIAPDRHATVLHQPQDPAAVTVSVTGLSTRTSLTKDNAVVEVSVEQERAGVTGLLGWEPSAQPPVLLPILFRDESTGETTWSGTVTLPGSRKTNQYRLVIKEFEVIPLDGGSPGRRLVYTDTFIV